MLIRYFIITILFSIIFISTPVSAKNMDNNYYQNDNSSGSSIESNYLTTLQVNIKDINAKVKKNLPDKFEFIQLINSGLLNKSVVKQ